jgi:3-dehydroquinate dehydratase-2
MYDGPIVEVHLSNIHRREAIYHRSLVSTVASGVIAGLGVLGYRLAIRAIVELAQDLPRARP